MNICVLQGVTVGEPRVAELPSGQWAVTFDVRTKLDGSPARSVPVEWTGPEKSIPKVSADTPVAVTGSLDRRFYRAGGSIQTRVFVRPDKIVVKQLKRQTAAIQAALGDGLVPPGLV